MTDNEIILLTIIVNLMFAGFGPSLGFEYPGKIEIPAAVREAPTIITYLTYVWNSVAFWFSVWFFQVEGGGILLSFVFYGLHGMVAWVAIKLARGTGG